MNRLTVWVRSKAIRRKVSRQCERLNHPLTMRLKGVAAQEPDRQIGERLRCRCGKHFSDIPIEL